MRNLKKALALVLALMMALSLMVTASASDYADDSAIEQDEAVSVMSALGVFNGMGDGTFAPDGTLTRAQAAKIITYMLLGQEVADSLPNTGSKFTDCRDGQWYVGSVNYLTDLGIVAGRNETTFDPKGNVNGYEFAKMLLGALGYNSKTEQFEGSSAWSINVATTARRAGLDEGLAVSTISSIALTREQAAKLAFNTLKANMVYYQGGVVVDNVTVNPTRYTVSNAASNDYRTASGQDTIMQFCEQYFPGLKYDATYATADDFGHKPDGQWVNGKTVAYTNLAEPTLVLTEDVDDGTGDALAKMLPKGADIKAGGVTPTTNGAPAESKVSSIAGLAALTGDGKQVEIYVNEDNKIDAIIVTVYTVRTVSSITEKNGATTYKFSGGASGVNKEDDPKVVLAGDIAKGDVVTTTSAGGKLYVYPTTKFTGSQTAKKGTTVTIGGAKYAIGTGVVGVDDTDFANSKEEGNYWADMNGFLVKVADIETEVDVNYAIITRVIYGASTPSLDNDTSYTVNVRAVLDDGSVMDATLKTAKAKTASDGIAVNDIICGNVKLGSNATVNQDGLDTVLKNKLFGYYIDDGKMVLDKVAPATASMTKDEVYQQALSASNKYMGTTSLDIDDPSITALFNSKTVFVIYNVDGNKVTAETHTGTAGLAINKTTGVDNGVIVMGANANTQGTAAVVFLKTTTVAPTVDYVYINVSNPESVLKEDKSGSVWKYTGITPDGEEIDVVTSAGAAGDKLAANGLYEYDANNVVDSDAKVTVASATAAGQFVNVTKAQTNEELILVNGEWLSTTDDTKIVYLDDLESIAGNNCFVEVKDGKVVTIFVYACRHTAKTWSKATVASAEDADVVYAADDHIQTCAQCSKVLAAHAAAFQTCAGGADHSTNHAELDCTHAGCTVKGECAVDHTAGSGDEG